MSQRSGRLVWKDEKTKTELRVTKNGFALYVDGIFIIDATEFRNGRFLSYRTKPLDTHDGRHSGHIDLPDTKMADSINGEKYLQYLKHYI